MKKLSVILILVVILAGCTDPEKVAKARAIERESQATATAAVIQAQATAAAIADKEQVRAATQAERTVRQETIIWSSSVAAVLVILAVGVTLAATVWKVGRSVAYGTQLKMMQVKVDKVTRTWPVLIDLPTGRLVDLETGERGLLDSVQALDHRRLVISGQARVTGLLAQSAERIARDTKDAKPGDMLPAVGQSVPLLGGRGGVCGERGEE